MRVQTSSLYRQERYRDHPDSWAEESHPHRNRWWVSSVRKYHQVHRRSINAKFATSDSHAQVLSKHICTATLARSHFLAKLKVAVDISLLFQICEDIARSIKETHVQKLDQKIIIQTHNPYDDYDPPIRHVDIQFSRPRRFTKAGQKSGLNPFAYYFMFAISLLRCWYPPSRDLCLRPERVLDEYYFLILSLRERLPPSDGFMGRDHSMHVYFMAFRKVRMPMIWHGRTTCVLLVAWFLHPLYIYTPRL